MNIHATVIEPIDEQLCRECRFCMHLFGDDQMAGVLVFCGRRDCDNTHPERLAPLAPARPPRPGTLPRPPGPLARMFLGTMRAIRDFLYLGERDNVAEPERTSGPFPGFAER